MSLPEGLTLFADACDPGVELIVELGLISATSPSAGVWDLGVWGVDEFDTSAATWGPDAVWDDGNVSEWVRSVEIDRKFSEDLKTWVAGSATVVLSDLDGRFSPDNLEAGAPYVVAGVSGIRPGCPIRIRLVRDGIVYPIFRGYIKVPESGWSGHYGEREGDAYVTLQCVDGWARLAGSKGHAVASAGAGESFGDRIVRILTAAGWTGPVSVDTGLTTMQATDLSTDRIEELNKTAESEGGAVWDEIGTITARDRYSLVEDERSINVQVSFTDTVPTGAEEIPTIPWSSIQTAPIDDSRVINHAIYTRTGGSEQEFVDPLSSWIYGPKDDPVNDLTCETDAQVLGLAQWAVLLHREPESRVESVTISPCCDLDTLAPIAAGTLVRDLVTVTLHPPSDTGHVMSRSCFISGIHMKIDENDWEVTFTMTSATVYRVYASSRWGADEDDTTAALWGASDTDPDGARWFV